MHLKVVIFLLSFLTTTAYPLHRSSREATWTDSNANQAHEKTELPKDVDQIYKTHIDSGDLYDPDSRSKNPVAEEMQRKLNMESERLQTLLRTRLRQELAELRERLSPSHLSSSLASMRERLAPLTQQLQSSLSSNTQDLCGQLSLYLQGLETAEAQAEASLYQEAFNWMSQTLEHSGSKVADLISDFHTKTVEVIEHLKEIGASEQEAAGSEHWQELSSRLGQEVSSLRMEAQNRAGALKAELAALLESGRPGKAEVTASMERFCQNAALQSQVFQTRMERLFQGLEEEVQGPSSLSPDPSSSSLQPAGYLQEDFSVKFSALIQDILHSV